MDADSTCHGASSIGLQAGAGEVPVPHLALQQGVQVSVSFAVNP
jgi:hypothetical protein